MALDCSDAEAAGGDAEPAADQCPHRDAEALALGAEQVVGRHAEIGQLEHAGVRRRHADLGEEVLAGPAAAVAREITDRIAGLRLPVHRRGRAVRPIGKGKRH